MRSSLGRRHICSNDICELARESCNARNALGLRVEPLVEHDLLELWQPVFQSGFQVGLIEELCVRQPRANDAFIASDNRLATVGRFLIGDKDEFVDELCRLRIAQDKAFLIVADGGADHLIGDRQECLVESAHQRDRPFDQARDFGEESFVFHQFKTLCKGEVLRVGEDDVRAPRSIEHDLGFLELGDVVIETAHLDRIGRHEAVAARFVAAPDAVDVERHDDRLFSFRAKRRNNGMKWAHPRQRAWRRRTRTPAHGFRPRERCDCRV